MTSHVRILGFLATVLLVLGGWQPRAEAGSPAAVEQLSTARVALQEGRFVDALVGAEAAFSLDSTASEAFRIKGLAYARMGEEKFARWQLRAYIELEERAGRSNDDPEVFQALQPKLYDSPAPDSLSGAVMRERLRQRGSSTPPPVLQERARAALREGACGVATAWAAEWAFFQPEEAAAHRLQGDTHRCTGGSRDALLAYGRVLELGADDPGLQLVIEGLKTSLSTLRVQVLLAEGRSLPLLELLLPGERLTERPTADGSVSFEHLPWGMDFELRLTGSGYHPMDVAIEPFLMGEERSVDLEPETAGYGEISLVEGSPAGLRVAAIEGGSLQFITREQPARVTSGTVRLQIIGEHGETQSEVEVAEGQLLRFDPGPWLPTSLVLSGLPGGSDYRIYLEGDGDALLERQVFVPFDGGELDPTTGVRIAPPQQVVGLIGGTGGLFVQHPSLGDGATPMTLEPGVPNTIQYRWRSMSGIPGVEARYVQWKDDRAAFIQGAQRRTRVSLVATLISSVVSGCLWAGAAGLDAEVSAARERGLSAVSSGEWGAVPAANLDNRAAARTQTGLAVAGTITGLGAVAGVVVTVSIHRSGRKQVADYPEWDPFQ